MREELQRLLSESISVEPKVCLNYLRKDIGCEQCVEHCPAEAISFQSRIPVIQHSKCVNCGACVSACPVLAIDHVQKPYHELQKQIEEHREARITCQRMESYQKGIKVPCYLYLDVPILLTYGKGKERLNFTIEPCQNCEYAFLNPKQHFLKLQEKINLYQIPLKIEVTEEPLTMEQKDEIVGGITRRDLLKKFSIKNLREVLLPEEEEEKENPKTISLTNEEKPLYKRGIFNQIVIQKYIDLGYTNRTLPEAEFIKIHIDDSCVGCNICESLCPTQALRWENDENESRLVFSAVECIACKNCNACPETSIQFQAITFEEYVQQKTNRLKSFSRKICTECGDEFRTKADENVCTFCSAKKEQDPLRFFQS
ncbi:4Fe-4S dicluster domain-containing protein [Tepidibacillus fermentans]|uniref:4Fe-4S dicluster protein n=1 Tax=Tepidibacillus fermentans TaxID=1281767 RepID=A0A4R3KKP6_9BACI|nr:4Fe-4S dicluster domain-containing protein [Tepidibacillus fermentans]TCS84463.1 4Fe-4S dicluster protein [Tepidibacillus fermentans]